MHSKLCIVLNLTFREATLVMDGVPMISIPFEHLPRYGLTAVNFSVVGAKRS